MNSYSDIKQFNELFNEYYERIVRFAKSYVRDLAVAEDFASEAFAAFWENRAILSDETNPRAYILTIVKNKCINYLKHEQIRLKAERELNDHSEWVLTTNLNTLEACDPDFIFSDEIQHILNETLEKMPQKTRQIFFLNRFDGLSYNEIALKMNVSPKTIEFHISKALRALRFALMDFICLLLFILLHRQMI
jgi:RNA polymerase sigma-70 factor (ECF subfamily)